MYEQRQGLCFCFSLDFNFIESQVGLVDKIILALYNCSNIVHSVSQSEFGITIN